MSYQAPPQVAFGEEITAFVVNQLRSGLTQYETFFNFTSPPPDIRMLHAASKFVMWSFYTTNNTETLQFNTAQFWDVGVAASVVMARLTNTAVYGGYTQLLRPSYGSNSTNVGGAILRIYANGDVTVQATQSVWQKILYLLSVMN